MTERGVPFDRNKCEQMIAQLQQREKDIHKELRTLVGQAVDIWAAASIASAFDRLSLPYAKTSNGAPSFTKSFLDSCHHSIAKLIVEARETNKTHSTFLGPYLNFSAATGRIHTHFNQPHIGFGMGLHRAAMQGDFAPAPQRQTRCGGNGGERRKTQTTKSFLPFRNKIF
ncbi:MAG: hypothetical protein EB121_06895 [Alphaproteobacteria bacterium]|nr:hypothetical protein [Alphaproteobacteria bacterium]